MADDTVIYPIGKWQLSAHYTRAELETLITSIEELPKKLRSLALLLTREQLQQSYREGAWSFCRLIHHIADSHLNAYVKYKWALTETPCTVKPYDENAWSVLSDAADANVSISLDLLDALHKRWVVSMRHEGVTHAEKTYYHPEMQRDFSVAQLIALYAWHGEHHYQQIFKHAVRNGWV